MQTCSYLVRISVVPQSPFHPKRSGPQRCENANPKLFCARERAAKSRFRVLPIRIRIQIAGAWRKKTIGTSLTNHPSQQSKSLPLHEQTPSINQPTIPTTMNAIRTAIRRSMPIRRFASSAAAPKAPLPVSRFSCGLLSGFGVKAGHSLTPSLADNLLRSTGCLPKPNLQEGFS